MSYSDDEDANDRTCYLCDSARFHDENGLTVCENGHQQSWSQAVGDDEDAFNTQGRRNRGLREKADRRKAAKVYSGKQAFELYLKAYQYILWKQCHDLISLKDLPPDLWIVVRDLWTLRLTKIVTQLEDGDELNSTEPASETTEGVGTDIGESTSGLGQKFQAKKSPKLAETVALCNLAILILRLPIGLAELFRWIEEGSLTYTRAIRHIPPDMRAKLPGSYHMALDTSVRPDIELIREATLRLQAIYSGEFGVQFPRINVNLLSYQYVKKLCVPIEVIPASHSLAKLLDYTFTYPTTRRKGQFLAAAQPESQLISVLITAIKLIFPYNGQNVQPSTLSEPAAQNFNWDAWLDSVTTIPSESSRPETTALTASDSSFLAITDSQVFDLIPLQLDQYLEWYQKTWIKPEKESQAEGFNREIFNMFPLPSAGSSTTQSPAAATTASKTNEDLVLEERLRKVHGNMDVRAIVPHHDSEDAAGATADEEPPTVRPGSQYRSARPVRSNDRMRSNGDDASKETRETKIEQTLLQMGAEVSGMSVKSLVAAVKETERKVGRWLDDKRRREYWDAMDLETEAAAPVESGDDEELMTDD